ncbi:MotA/TolQ/ExbB proton channel family protein [Ruegeria halocynthiae]|uniref:MotA/TolQ/ExbB proton channel family protein n=1 Tax=Ruegeria halocynthiae TaxID=985054 RepID=UPI003AF32891
MAALVVTSSGLAAQDATPQPAPQVSQATPNLPAPGSAIETPPLSSSEHPAEQAPAILPATETVAEVAPLAQQPPLPQQEGFLAAAQGALAKATDFLRTGGPSIWVIAALSVITVALILWKIWRLALIGAWSRGKAGLAVDLYEVGNTEAALATVRGRRGIRSKVLENAILALHNMPENRAREEVSRVAKREIANAGTGLRALELIATIAPLLGLLGTVLGMIAAFQALQHSGSRADPALLAGGIWEALLTTAAGMAVAIPASAALTWFEAVIDRIRRDVEDGATRLFVSIKPRELNLAAE